MRFYDYLQTPFGRMLLVATGGGLSGVHFVGQQHYPKIDPAWKRDPARLARAKRELLEYFAGRRTKFGVALDPQGTEFQKRVWGAIAKVGCGETISYAELARRAGFPGSARAAGAATGRNPVGIIVPCHRIVGSNGSLTGYAGGLARKKALLSLEGATSPRLARRSAARASRTRRSSAAPARASSSPARSPAS